MKFQPYVRQFIQPFENRRKGLLAPRDVRLKTRFSREENTKYPFHAQSEEENFKIKIWAEGEKTSDGERGLCIKFRFFRVVLPLGVACSIVGLDR